MKFNDAEYERDVTIALQRGVCPMCGKPPEQHDITPPNDSWPNGTMRCRRVPASESAPGEE